MHIMVLIGYHNTNDNLSYSKEVVNCLYDFFKSFCSNLNTGGKTNDATFSKQL